MQAEQAREIRRREFIMENQLEWIERGQGLKNRRDEHNFPISFVAMNLGISPKRLKKYEEGEPVMDSKLITNAYIHFLDSWDMAQDLRKLVKKYK